MDQITGNPRCMEERSSGWKHAHQRLSIILTERRSSAAPIQAFMRSGTTAWVSRQSDERKFMRP
jgi:septum formation topological specificity factor MinE